MDNRLPLTAAILIAVLVIVAWFADRISRLPLTWQTIVAVSASLLLAILIVVWVIVRTRE